VGNEEGYPTTHPTTGSGKASSALPPAGQGGTLAGNEFGAFYLLQKTLLLEKKSNVFIDK